MSARTFEHSAYFPLYENPKRFLTVLLNAAERADQMANSGRAGRQAGRSAEHGPVGCDQFDQTVDVGFADEVEESAGGVLVGGEVGHRWLLVDRKSLTP